MPTDAAAGQSILDCRMRHVSVRDGRAPCNSCMIGEYHAGTLIERPTPVDGAQSPLKSIIDVSLLFARVSMKCGMEDR